jgi:hypothetical protein
MTLVESAENCGPGSFKTSLATFFSDSGENYTNEDLRITHNDITSGVISSMAGKSTAYFDD